MKRSIATVFVSVVVLGAVAVKGVAAPPDLTAGGTPTSTRTQNLGPTGMRGWVYATTHAPDPTSESRQILVTEIDAGSPAAGTVATNDVIIGAAGTGTVPVVFTADARRGLAQAIAEAEARDPATLDLLVWRAGVTNTLPIMLRPMGAYSATAPYHCPKSSKILQEGLQQLFDNETSGRYSFGAMALLASTNIAYQARVQSEARALIPTTEQMAAMVSDERSTASCWGRGYELLFQAEYYLATGDTNVLPSIEARAIEIARNQSLFGTLGHIFAEKNDDGSDNGSMGGGYGVINTPGLNCFLGIQLARECGVTNAYIEPAIERCSRFFAYFAGRGTIPYGEHTPYVNYRGSNGKNAVAALAFSLQTNRLEACHYFSKLCATSDKARESGHTGPFFEYLWAPLGANAGGEAAAASFFNRIRWHLDLQRRWDGAFAYDNLASDGGEGNGNRYYDFNMTAAAMLTYALPFRRLHVTGANQDTNQWLSAGDVAEIAWAAGYDPTARSDAELISDLDNWSPVLTHDAALELGNRSINSTELNQIIALAEDTNGMARVGACDALGWIGDSGGLNTLATLLTDGEDHVRYMAAESLRYIGGASTVLDMILSAADTTARPLRPFDEEDPLHFDHGRLAMLLFYGGNAYGPKGLLYNNITGIDRDLLYPAIKAVAANPVGQARSTLGTIYDMLSYDDMLSVAGSVVDSVMWRSPADKMFSTGVRTHGLELLERYGIAEGVPLGRIAIEDDRDKVGQAMLQTLEDYAGATLYVTPDPDIISFLEGEIGGPPPLPAGRFASEATAALTAVTNDASPYVPMPLKRIVSVSADENPITLSGPTVSTALRVDALDYAEGDAVFTWRKLHGASPLDIAPNGTPSSTNATLIFDAPGRHTFEVTMSDSRGLTEVSTQLVVIVYDSGGGLPSNALPTADAQTVVLVQDQPAPITLTGSDPDGYPLVFTITTPPDYGFISGSGSTLVYHPDTLYVGPDSFLFDVMDSEGATSTATVDITVEAVSHALEVYEPFAYTPGGLDGQYGIYEVGLAGSWDAHDSTTVIADTLSYGSLVTRGGRVGFARSVNRYGGGRSLDAQALSDNGLLDDGATLWFSILTGVETNANGTNVRLAVALATDPFGTGNGDWWIQHSGSGVGLYLPSGVPRAAAFAGSGAPLADPDVAPRFTPGVHGVVVGKIVWGATSADPDSIALFIPDTSMGGIDTPVSTYTTTVDQAAFDTLTFRWGDLPILDEIRFGASYASVVYGVDSANPDVTPPIPDPMRFDERPKASGTADVAMTAVIATDRNGPVEYYFENSTTLDNSGWTPTPAWTNTGLSFPLGEVHGFRVKARDVHRNETAWSDVSTAGNADTLSLNFFAYGRALTDEWLQESWRETVRLDPTDTDRTAGVWETADWSNVGPENPGTTSITNPGGATATLTLNNERNAAPYWWADTRDDADAVDVGNATLLDGHRNGTEYTESGGPSTLPDMIADFELSGISYAMYDVIIYLGGNAGQAYEGRGAMVFNGTTNHFALTPDEPDGALVKIVDETTPGNYMLYEHVTGPSFSARIWGEGFTHIGPSGIQVRQVDVRVRSHAAMFRFR
ncbi:MAG: hypothetical protein HN919_16230 [Verrucomicrobia bacterium]|nr:hypothetical protein [Verrucomicrobiota bacterium]MBT7067848.1 hypothetical protein [Verrucomicrobiota bacterium]